MRSKRFKVAVVVLSLAAVAIGGLVLSWWVSFGRSMGQGLAAIANLGVGGFAQIFVIQKDDPVRNQLKISGDLAHAYQDNPVGFKDAALLVKTWTNAMVVADATFQRNDVVLPFRSDSLNLANYSALDAWRNAFCVSGNRETLVVVSAGATGQQLNCKTANIDKEKLAGIPRSVLIKTDTGYLVLLADWPRPGKPKLRFVVPEGPDEVRIYELKPSGSH